VDEINKLYYGDNLEVLRKYLKDETVDLCYIDPPFNSKRNYNQIYNNIGKEDKAQAQAFVDTWTWDDDAINGYDDIIVNYNNSFTKQTIQLITGLEKVLGKGSLLAYLIHITLRAVEIQRILKPTGTFYLHCDPTASHYIKIILDSVFCSKGGDFLNEIIWHYRRWTNAQNQYQSMHDVILFYSKSEENKFHFTEVDMSESQKKKFERGWDSNVIHTKKEKYSQLIVYNEIKFKNAVKAGTMDEGKYKNIIYRDKPMVPASDVIIMPVLNSQAKERMGYPTQKPEALLEKFILSSTDKNDVVLDAYCGCGTTVAVAENLKRKWIGIDITYQSISLILKRLKDNYGKNILDKIELNGVPQDLDSAIALANKKEDKTRKEFEKWSVLTYSDNRAIINEKKGADGGVDGVAFINDYINDSDVGIKEILFSVKSDKKPHVSYIRDLNGTMQRENAVMGYFITLYPPTKDMLEEAKKLGKYKNKYLGKDYDRIKIVTIDQILKGEIFDVPKSQEIKVVKTADKKDKKNQGSLEF
jgi:DNA modification methylase